MAGTTNFQQWDPALTASESDSQYTADTMRSGGAALDALLPHQLFNKFAHQQAIFTAAFCQMLANKGYSPSDVSFPNLVAILMNVLTTADSGLLITTIPYASIEVFDASVAAKFLNPLTGDVASSTLINTVPGQWLMFIFTQDATGGRAFSWPPNISFPGTISDQPNSTSIQTFVVRPDGVIDPVTPMMVLNVASQPIIGPLPFVEIVTSSGYVSSSYAEIIEEANASSGVITRTLFSAIGMLGRKVRIKKVDSSINAAGLAAFTGQTIDGQASVFVAKQNDSITIISDGANWIII